VRASRGISGTLLVGLVVAALGFGCASASAAWTILSTSVPAGTSESRLFGVSCWASVPCWAVGEYRNSSGVVEPFAWNPSTAIYELPPTPGTNPQLLDVSCPLAALNEMCMAVGRYTTSGGTPQAFAEKWTPSGHWVLQTLPFPAGNTASELGSISCALETECMATGDYHNATGIHYFAEHWTGGAWTAEAPAEAPGIGYQALTGISCPLSGGGKCISVGEYRVSPYALSSQRMETEIYSPGWTYQGGPSGPGAPFFAPGSGTVPVLATVSCSSFTLCVGVGYYTTSSGTLERMIWNKKSATPGWAEQSQFALAGETRLTGVSCRSSTSCVAVGQHKTAAGVASAFAEELSTGTWSQITLPTGSGAIETNLNRDSCVTASGVNFCLAVGSSTSSGGVTSLLVERNF
jgi:hypothetical protein